ncbi:MAG: ATP-binding protein, partial [Polyangiales bacterium]
MPPSKPLYGGLRGSLIGAIIASTVALVTTVLLLEDPLVEERELYRIQHMLRRQATEIESALARGDSPEHIRTRLEQPGRLGIDIRRHAKAKQSWSVDPLALPRGFSMRSDPRSSERFLQFHLRTGNGWHLYLVHSLASIERIRGAMRELLLVGGVVAALLSALLMWVLSRTMVSPIKDLTKAARALARGDLSVRTQSRRRDELGKLGRALDRMADQLDERLRTLRAGEARLRTVLNAMVEAVFVTGADRRIILSNQALVTLLGADPVGQSVLTAMRSSALHKAIRAARKGKRVAVQLSLETNGGPRSLSAHLAPLPERSGVVGVLHDITELMHADAVRRDFVANASHELRTPLTAIRGAVETLLDGAASDKETTERFLRLCLRHSLRLQRLVDDLLSLSKAESPEQRFDLGAVQVDKVVQEVLSQLETQAHGKHIHLEWEGERAQALGHARALDELIYNLVDNAIKYTPAGGRVRLRAQQDLNRVHLEVKDTGPGIPAQHIERIFERFYRVDTGRSREVGGTGLGLSIVKHLAS